MVFNLAESERQLQDYFIELLKSQGYEEISIKNEKQLISNFQTQLELFNNKKIYEFDEVLDYLCSGDRNSKFDKLRSSFNNLKFIDFSDFSANIFQVAQEITVSGDLTNRYDVTILINGIPIVQIELKNSSVELKSAFNQIKRYKLQSYSGLFDLIQIFIISNKVHTKYFFNDSNFNYDYAYEWLDKKDLESFTNSFLDRQNLMSVLSDYIFKDPLSNKYLMLRPYQVNIINDVKSQIDKNENAYVWMSYNTGRKTTSFRLAWELSSYYKVIYVNLNQRNIFPQKHVINSKKEFINAVDGNNLIVTNIRSIIPKDDELDDFKDYKFIFIFDEYEKRYSRYSPTKLIDFYQNSLFYCFTSAPIFDENIIHDRTTKYIFSNQIDSYSFKDALADKTNLNLNVEFVGDENISPDCNLSSKSRLKSLANYIVENYNDKSNNREFKSILFASRKDDLINYYKYLKDSDINIAPILRYDSNDLFEEELVGDYFEKFILDYKDNYSSDIKYKKVVDTGKISNEYELDVVKRFENGEIDLVLVDESILNDKYKLNILGNLKNDLLNTIYLDCDLNYESLFEALTMVNEVGNSQKNQGNIVLFRDLRKNISDTIKLFTNNNSPCDYTLKDYNYYLDKYNQTLFKISNSKNIFEDYKELSNYFEILESFNSFEFSQNQIDQFNAYKDDFIHKNDDLNSSKTIIQSYKPCLIDQFTIDLAYIDELDNEEIEIKTPEVEKEDKGELNDSINSNNKQDFSKTVNIKNEYHIHVNEDNFLKEDDLIDYDFKEIMGEENKQLGKICPRCNLKYSNEYNYCSMHKGEIKLVYITDLVKVCRSCGKRFPKDYNYCNECGCDQPLKFDVTKINTNPNRYFNFKIHSNKISDISQLLSSENIDKIENFYLTELQFNEIIENIKRTFQNIFNFLVDKYNIDLNELSTLDKIFLFSKSIVKTDYKEGGGNLGYYQFNEIHIDDRAPDALQITTLIHEMSHFFLSEIFEQILSIILDSDKTAAIESFVCYMLNKDHFNYLVDEYCAHTVEGRFSTFGYQDYSSYEQKCQEYIEEFSKEYYNLSKITGNTFAKYIKKIFEEFIDDRLRGDIKKEFERINDIPKYPSLQYETTATFNWTEFGKIINAMFKSSFDDILTDENNLIKLNEYKNEFLKNSYTLGVFHETE